MIDVEPQVFDVLAYLLRHRERVVPKTELLDQIWGNRFVSESGRVCPAGSSPFAAPWVTRQRSAGHQDHLRPRLPVRGRCERAACRRPDRGRRGAKSTAPAHQVLRAVSDVARGHRSGDPDQRRSRVGQNRAAPPGGRNRPAPGAGRRAVRTDPSQPQSVPVHRRGSQRDGQYRTPDCLMRSRPDAGPNSSEPSPGGCPRHVSAGSWRCASSSSWRRSSRARCSCSTISISLIARPCSWLRTWPG